MKTITIDPMTRISGMLSVAVTIEKGRIIDAKCGGMQFRGFNTMLENRPPLDAIRLTPRICGICSAHHATASSKCLENAFLIKPDPNGELIREMTNGFEFLQNHLRQLCQFAFPDYVNLQQVNPLYKQASPVTTDFRLPENVNSQLAHDYIEAIRLSRLAHKALAILGGKAPHSHGIYLGGTTTNLTIESWQSAKAILMDIKAFILDRLREDFKMIALYYDDYFEIGKGYGNYLTYGMYEGLIENETYVAPSIYLDGKIQPLDPALITTGISHSWLTSETPPKLDLNKEKAYSFVETARYDGKPFEVGPLARMILSGHYPNQNSTMDRLMARCQEAEIICHYLEKMFNTVTLQPAVQQAWKVPSSGKGYSLIEATRGSLGHFIEIEDSKIKRYTVITPSEWNFAPIDELGQVGPVEKALIGTHLQNPEFPNTEIGRIVRSFDPCLNCAAHITSDQHQAIQIQLV